MNEVKPKKSSVAFVCDIEELKSERLMPIFWLLPKIGFVVNDKNEKYFKSRAVALGQKMCFENHRENKKPEFEFIGFNGLFSKKKLAKITIEVLE